MRKAKRLLSSKVRVLDSKVFAFSDPVATSGKGSIKLDGFGDTAFNITRAVLGSDFKPSNVKKGKKVIVYHIERLKKGNRSMDNVTMITALDGSLLWTFTDR